MVMVSGWGRETRDGVTHDWTDAKTSSLERGSIPIKSIVTGRIGKVGSRIFLASSTDRSFLGTYMPCEPPHNALLVTSTEIFDMDALGERQSNRSPDFTPLDSLLCRYLKKVYKNRPQNIEKLNSTQLNLKKAWSQGQALVY